eukprot:3639154-Amphidinium_carterae.2
MQARDHTFAITNKPSSDNSQELCSIYRLLEEGAARHSTQCPYSTPSKLRVATMPTMAEPSVHTIWTPRSKAWSLTQGNASWEFFDYTTIAQTFHSSRSVSRLTEAKDLPSQQCQCLNA